MKTLQPTKRNSVLNLCLRALALLCLFSLPAFAVVNQAINYQGFLVSKATNLAVDTPQAMKFVLHTTPVGDTTQFTETRCSVSVSKGRYDVEIGSATAGGVPSAVLVNNQNVWLEIQVSPSGACGGPYEAMQPRIKLAASPYSFSSVYASTASAATTIFKADTIGSLDVTTNGALTISTNLFVMGGISVGSISPGQKLSVNGIVQVTGGGNGFMFPDGSIQTTAVANTIWQLFGDNAGSINAGNIGISTGVPQARLHISTGTCPACTVLSVTAGPPPNNNLLNVTGEGYVTAPYYFGNGTNLTGVVLKAGDTMGPLTLTAGSSITVTAANGIMAPRIKLFDNVEISSTNSLSQGGVYISTNVFLPSGAKYYGDGSMISGVVSADPSKVPLAGGTMTGLLTLPSLALTTGTFMVGGSTFTVQGGSVSVAGGGYLARFTVGGGIVATSSITAQGNLYAPVLVATSANIAQGLTASSGVFTAVGQWALVVSSTVRVNGGDIWLNPGGYYYGNGSQLTGVNGTDSSKVAKTGDTMTGNLRLSGSSMTVIYAHATEQYAFTVSSAQAPPNYWLSVSTGGNVGVQLNNPAAPLGVYRQILVSNRGIDVPASLHLNPYNDSGYIRWSDTALVATTFPNQGALGFIPGPVNRDLAYRAGGSDPSTGGEEVFRIRHNEDGKNWKFGIGTTAPAEKFHVAANLLVGLSAANPILYISTTTGQVGISTDVTTHALRVNGGVIAVSSITAQGGFFGSGAGLTQLNAGALPANISVTNIAASDANGVKFSSAVTMSLVPPFTGDGGQSLQVDGSIRIGANADGEQFAYLSLRPLNGPTYIRWSQQTGDAWRQAKGALGFLGDSDDLIYRANATTLADGTEIFKIMGITPGTGDTSNFGKFGIGTGRVGINPLAGFHVATDLLVSTAVVSPILFISTATGKVGIGTAGAQGRLHVVSNSITDPYVFAASHTVTGGLVVSTSGRVGIGITSGMGARLDVKQSAADAYALRVSSNDGTAMMVVDKAGRHGMGTVNPQGMLHIFSNSTTDPYVFVSSHNIAGGMVVSTSGNVLAEGNYDGTVAPPITGLGTRFMWIPGAAAIRAGRVGGTQWDVIGNYSTAFGWDTQAPGNYSVAIGQNNASIGEYSMAVGGRSNVAEGKESVATGGIQNKVYGEDSFISGGSYNVVHSSSSWAGGYNNYLAASSSGTFVWGYDDFRANNNGLPITDDFVFLIDPADVKGYRLGVGTPSPQTRLEVNGSAQFGAGTTKSTFTAEGFWVPRSMTTAELQAAGGTPPVVGAVVFNSTIANLCVSTGTAVGQWAVVGPKTNCI